jgi:ABC-2 type transport system ATP-binding protein
MADERLDVDRVSKRFGDVVALKDMTFDVRAGALFGFLGSNGAGKTTTMRVIMGVLLANAGEVRWAGTPLGPQTRRRIGYPPEQRGLYPKVKMGEQLGYLARRHGMSAAHAAVRAVPDRLPEQNTKRGRTVESSIGWSIGDPERAAIAQVPPSGWSPTSDADGGVHDGAQIAGLTGLLTLAGGAG